MMKKRILSVLLVCVMVLSMLIGCGKKEEESGSVSNKLVVGLQRISGVKDYEENALTEYLEEVTGAEIEFQFFSGTGSEAKQQLTLMCNAKEELPDVIVGFNSMGHYTANQFGEDGFFIDLTDLIDKYAVNYKEQLSKLPEEQQEYLKAKGTNTNDGCFYAMPRVACEAMDYRQNLMYINKTWLDTLGLQVPTTIAELENVLQAFKTRDPNGNGTADEIPMLLLNGGTSYIINAYMRYESGTFNVDNGVVWDPVVTNEFRQALIKANELMAKDLYSELSFTVSTTEYEKLISPMDGPGRVGIFSGHHETYTNEETDILDDYIALVDLADETGKGGYTIVSEPSVTWGSFITKDCENTELAMKFLDAFYADEAVTRQRHGEKDVEWAYEEGTNAYGTASYTKNLTELGVKSGYTTWGQVELGIYTHWNYLLVETKGEGRTAQASRLQTEQWNIIQEGRQPEETIGDLVYTQEEYDIREAKFSICQSYISESITLFVSGEKNPKSDADWNEFLKNLESYERSELLDVAQSAYTRKIQ